MRKMAIIIISIFYFQILTAPPNGAEVVFESERVNPFEDLWQATCFVESSGNRFAIGDNGKSWGIAQIQQSRIDDYYQRTGIRFELSDMFDVEKSREVFMYYCSDPYNLEAISRSWNGGNNWRQKKQTHDYWYKVQKFLYRYRSQRKDVSGSNNYR